MTSWNPITPFSGFAWRDGQSGGDPGSDRIDDDWDEHLEPPADDVVPDEPASFETELSFGRAAGDDPAQTIGGWDDVWEDPPSSGPGGEAADGWDDFEADAYTPAPAHHDEESVEPERAPERIPFFKREISFRRKKRAAVEADASEHAWADEPVELGVPEAEPEVEPEVEPEPVPVSLFTRELSFRRAGAADASPEDDVEEHVADIEDDVAAGVEEREPELEPAPADEPVPVWAAGAVEDEKVAEVEEVSALAVDEAGDDEDGPELAADEPQAAPRVPFYKRELSFGRRRRKAVAADALDAGTDGEAAAWPDAEEDAWSEDETAAWREPVAAEAPLAAADDLWHDDEPAAQPVAETPAFDDAEDDPWRVEEQEQEQEQQQEETVVQPVTEAPAFDDAGDADDDPWHVGEEQQTVVEPVAEAVEPVAEAAEPVADADEPDDADEIEPWAETRDEGAAHAASPGRAEAGSDEPDPWADAGDELLVTVPEPEGPDDVHDVDGEGPFASAPVEVVVPALPPTDEHAGWEPEPDTGGEEHAPWALDGAAEALDAPVAEYEPVVTRASRFRRPERGGPPRSQRGGKQLGGKPRGRTVGLKIGASQLAAAVVVSEEGRHEVVELARAHLEPGIVVDGEVRDAEALVHALRAFFEEFELPTKDVRIGLASNRIGVRTFDVVGVEDDDRFDNAVRFKAHEVLPIAVHESVLDYRVLSERTTETGEPSRRVLLVVAPRDQVEPYVQVCREAGLKLTGIDLEALGLLRTFVELKPPMLRASDDTATVIVSIGHESTTLLVAGGGVCEFTRVFDWGGGTLQEAIANELQVPLMEAATILRHLSLSGATMRPLESLDDDARRRAIDAVRLRLMPFARELVSSLQFYQTQQDSLGIGEIVLTGGTSHLEGLPEALNQMIGVAVRVGDPLARVVAGQPFPSAVESSIGSLAAPIGLALQDDPSRSVDLLPADARQSTRKGPDAKAVLLPLAAVVPLVALGFLFWQANGQVSDKSGRLSTLQAEFAALPKPAGVDIDPSLQGEQAQRATAVAEVLASRTAWDDVLGDVSRVLPEDVWLTQLTAKAPAVGAGGVAAQASAAAAAASSKPTGVAIGGYTYDHTQVARLLARLATVPSLTNVQLASSQQVTVGDKKVRVVQFSILADLSGTGGAK